MKNKNLIKVFLLIITFLCVSCNEKKQFEVTFYKIGKADSSLILDNNKIILIDTGEEDDSEEIINSIKEKGIKKIDYLILSHYDKDHIGSAANIILNFDINRIIGPDYVENSIYYDALNEAITTKKYKFEKLSSDLLIDNIKITVAKKVYSNENDMSLIVNISNDETNFLFLGDIMEERINDILNEDLKATLVKIPHHGKTEKNSSELVSKVEPEYAIITSSNKNPEDSEMLEILSKENIKTFLTRNGNIICSSDGKKVTCNQKN